MRARLILAFSVSIMLIGVATWSRFAFVDKPPANIVAVTDAGSSLDDSQEVLKDFLAVKTATSTLPAASEKPVTDTDLIGRQLILDYVGLAASGGAGTESIDALANKYIESIPTLNRAPVLSYADLKTVTNTRANFQSYADKITKIYKSYEAGMKAAGLSDESNYSLNPALYSSAAAFSKIYEDTATALKNMPVPGALLQSHLGLINTYLSNAEAMVAVSNTQENSAAAFAGLVALNENIDKEQESLTEITRILTSNGI